MRALFFVAGSLAIFLLAGCDSKTPQSAAPATDSVPLFKAGKGVLFSEGTKKLFGVETAEVVERPMRIRIEKTVEVFRSARENLPGGAIVRCSAQEAKELTPGQTVALHDAANPDKSVTGRLVRFDAQTDSALGYVEALIDFADPSQAFGAGKFVDALFECGEAKPTLAVPVSGLLEASDGSYVYVVNGSYLTRTRVKAGPNVEGFVAITDGLYAGDAVAAKGVDNLWLVELSALKGGTPCCPVPKKEAK